MHQVFRQIIEEFRERELPKATRRRVELPIDRRGAVTFSGMRRSGKTYLLFQLIGDLLEQGVDKRQLLYANLGGMTGLDLEALFQVFHQESGPGRRYLFLDEIEKVSGWEPIVSRLVNGGAHEVYMTGSSLRSDMATLACEVFPFSFSEYLDHLGPAHVESPPKKVATTYMMRGGFPESVGLDSDVHEKLLQGYMESVIDRDTAVLLRFMTHCLQNAGGLLNVSRVRATLQAEGFAVGENTLNDYLDHLIDAGSLFLVPHYGPAQKPRKIYPVDPGLVPIYSAVPENSTSSAFESVVFSHLRRQTEEIFYFHTEDDREIDFLLPRRGEEPLLIQACVTLDDPRTREREVHALESAMRELGVGSGLIVSLDREEALASPAGEIRCVPLWQFLLH